MKTPKKWIVGIDEAGRGPLAGPVSVGAFLADKETGDWILKNIFENKLRDSKKLSPPKREEIYKKLSELKKENPSTKLGTSKVSFSVAHISNKIIDEKGISYATNLGVKRCLKNIFTNWSFFRGREFLDNHKNFKILLDGLLKAPNEYKNQKTIVGGDSKDIFIACASIVAKVERDRLMCELALKYPKYNFETHKGYGTLLHSTNIKKYGLSPIHRQTFCKNLTKFLK